MIDHVKILDKFLFDCDTPMCPTEQEFETDKFDEALIMAKLKGWKIFKTKDGWRHQCPNCKN